MCCSPIDSAPSGNALNLSPKGKAKNTAPGSCCRTPGTHSPPSKRPRHSQRKSPSPSDNHPKGPALPPILSVPSSSAVYPSVPPPSFPAIPPLGAIVSLAGTGCTCGFDCTCPGCTEHRGQLHAAKDRSDCPDGCGTCVDPQLGMELPTSTPFGTVPASTSSTSFIDAFFARAAAIPPPPSERASSMTLDGSNVTVYPKSLFSGDRRNLDEVGRAFGLVNLPKLECCAGRCGCPGDSCGCGDNCGGCCSNHEGGESKADENSFGDPLPSSRDAEESTC